MSATNISENDSEETDDPTLDITSEHFDPLKALYAKNVKVPYKNAKVYDNLSQYESAINKSKTTGKQTTNHSTNAESAPSSSNTQTKAKRFDVSDEPVVRRFLPHQQMIKGHRKEKHSRNILKKIEKGFGGPIDSLKVYMAERKRVKIYTRKEHGIRGDVTGFIESFDKHWNIVLSDVCEVWTRKKINFCDAADGSPEDCSRKLKQLKLQFPTVHVKSLNRKYVQCTRNVPQLMVRGEQVALVMLDSITK
ncbi:hypothetical protein HA402_014986 [Bradysia odoriphaga]|nr:hypothetical protein HA402_014986 [Bradysia odoriphaga]